MSLYVDGNELAQMNEKIASMEKQYNRIYEEFKEDVKELGNYFEANDYNALVNDINVRLEPISGANGEVITLMREMQGYIVEKAGRYAAAQKKNIDNMEMR